MTELEFTLLAPSLKTGDLVMMDRRSAPDEPSETIPGVILRFPDPSKPILFYRIPPRGDSAGLEFLQDLLYSPEAPFPVHFCSFWTIPEISEALPGAAKFLSHLEELLQLPLRSEGDLFDAYAAGILGKTFPLPAGSPLKTEPATASAWSDGVMKLLGVDTGRYQVLQEATPQGQSQARDQRVHPKGEVHDGNI
ncbi:hypothetical protein [Alkalispirochaeta alkalica]|uniref:hypothetical protein n=1 Tax=Alkalispirochaeta alkalica TaxID=46356 RepID=UPI000372C7E2|nr:hypothetical protein [Alkalispirochaeta alkalica]